MVWKSILGIASLAALAGLLVRTRLHAADTGNRDAGKGSIMDPEPSRMSLFSADNVRLLSDAQIRAIERGEEDPL